MRRAFACSTETGRIGRHGGRSEIRFWLPADQGGELVHVPSGRYPIPWGRMAGAPAPLSIEARGKGNGREKAQQALEAQETQEEPDCQRSVRRPGACVVRPATSAQ